jgi:AcrR family transcriptional regulator
MLFTIGRRERARARKLEDILEVSAHLIEEGGLEALTIHRLAGELDCAAGGIYRYFPSMSALFGELQRRIVREYEAALTAELESKKHDSLGALARIAVHYHRWFSARPGKLGLIAMGMADPRHILSDDDNERLAAEAAPIVARLVQALESAVANEQLSRGPAIPRAFGYWSAIQGVLSFRKLGRLSRAGLPKNDELLVEVAGTLLMGWGANRRAVRRAFTKARER